MANNTKVLWSLKNMVAFTATLFLALYVNNTVISAPSPSVAEAQGVEKTSFDFTGVEIDVSAKAFAIFDPVSGEILYSQNEATQLPIASITKIITATIVKQTLTPEETVVITNQDVETYGEAGKLKVGQEYTNRELLFPLLLESSNDAATSLQRSSGDMVVSNMNDYVRSISAHKTKLADPSGLSSGNVSTVGDLSVILSDIYKNHRHVLDISKLSQYVGPYTGWVNNSPVLDKSYQGGKHGYTNAAGRTATVLFSEEIAGDEKLLGYIVLASDDLKSDISTLRVAARQAVVFE